MTTRVSPEGSGNVTPVSGLYNENTEIQITATPAQEYLFVNWADDATGNENPMTVVMTRDKVITAVFQKVQYALNITVVGEGSVQQEILAAKSATDYPSGTLLKLTAVPDAGWTFLKWSGDYAGTENPIEVTMTEAMTLTAHFEPENLQKTYVPDNQFEKALIDLGYDDFVDDYVLTAIISNIESLDISDKNIVDLTGLEDFAALKFFTASNNHILSADFSLNTNLSVIGLQNNDLARLDLSAMNCLLYVNVKENPLSCVQVNEQQVACMVPADVYMKLETDAGVEVSLDCEYGTAELTYVPDDNFEQALIDLGYDDKMDDFVLTANISQVEELDISDLGIHGLTGLEGFAALESLDCSNNLIKSLDLSRNPKLGSLQAENNEIRTINLSQSSDLYGLTLKGNVLSEIDLSNTGSLIWLDVSYNNLESLDISAVNLWTMFANNNLLTCIQINEAQLEALAQYLSCQSGNYNCWIADPGVEFALDCNQ